MNPADTNSRANLYIVPRQTEPPLPPDSKDRVATYLPLVDKIAKSMHETSEILSLREMNLTAHLAFLDAIRDYNTRKGNFRDFVEERVKSAIIEDIAAKRIEKLVTALTDDLPRETRHPIAGFSHRGLLVLKNGI